MSVAVRLSRTGKRGERKFRIVVKEKRSKRDGKAIEFLGSYEKKAQSITKNINKERLNYWLSKGAQLSPAVKNLIK